MCVFILLQLCQLRQRYDLFTCTACRVRLVMLFSLRYEREGRAQTSDLLQRLQEAGVSRQLLGLVRTLLLNCGQEKRIGDLFSDMTFSSRFATLAKQNLKVCPCKLWCLFTYLTAIALLVMHFRFTLFVTMRSCQGQRLLMQAFVHEMRSMLTAHFTKLHCAAACSKLRQDKTAVKNSHVLPCHGNYSHGIAFNKCVTVTGCGECVHSAHTLAHANTGVSSQRPPQRV